MTRSYPVGVPCWIATEQPDLEKARFFYAKLMQWSAAPIAGDDDYLVAQLDQLTAAGICAGSETQARWSTYVAVDDIEAAVARVAEHDGTVHAEPHDVGRRARAARCEDPAGARFGLWQSSDLAGAEVRRIPGAWEVSDLHCDDPMAVQDFYGAVLGWETGTVDVGAGQWATMLCVPGYGEHRALEQSDHDHERQQATGEDIDNDVSDAIGWLAPVDQTDDGPDWRVTFTVAQRDAAARTAERHGAEVISQIDSRWSRTALVRDPQGALLTLSQALPGS